MRHKEFSISVYIAIHDNIINSLKLSKQAFIERIVRQKYFYIEKSINSIIQFIDIVKFRMDKFDVTKRYKTIYMNINSLLIKNDPFKIDFVIYELNSLKDFWIKYLSSD
jgi:hypothetical protein